MKRAHGTAETVFKLAMPPLRAEVIPVPGDFNAFQVRLWNLGARAGDAVTLNLDKVSLSSVKFEGAPMGTVAVATLGPGEAQLAPGGAPWTSPQFTLSLTEQGLLKFSTFSAVVVEARLSGLDPAPVKLSVPIPNGFPVVNQLTSTVPLNAETHAVVTESNCCSTMCTPCGENAEYVQPVTQTITGFIGRYSSRLDTLGRPAFGTTRSAIDSDTRIAGVTLVAWGRLGARYDAPIRMNRSSLTITNSQLFEQRGDTWVRREGAPDEADPDRLGFTATVDVRDFYSATAGSAASTQTVHLVVWMTSGAVYTQNVALWPMRRPETVAAAIAGSELCTGVNGLRNMQYEAASGCRSSVSGTPPMCSNGSWNSSTRKVIFGPLRGLGTADSEYFALYPNLKLLRLAGVDVAGLSATCDPSTVNLGTNFMIRCFSDYSSFIMENVADGRMGACPMISTMPQLPREATMRLDWPPELRMSLLKVFGREDLPAFENVELR
jgi:hypothetical protein